MINECMHILRVSSPDEQRIVVDSTNDIITGQIRILSDQNIEVVRVIEHGPKGEKGDVGEKGDAGLSGAGRPFIELIAGSLYESTSSISILGNVYNTGSMYISETLGVGINLDSDLSAILNVVGSTTGSDDIVSFGSEDTEFMRVTNDGITVLGQISGSQPLVIEGGVYFSGAGFYVGI